MLKPAALLAALGAVLARCGSVSPPNPADQTPTTPTESAFAWTRCMRAHGADVPDPHVAVNNGETSISQVMPARAAAAPAFKTAMKSCARFQQSPENARRDRHAPSKQVLLAFARCLRAHGVSDFPDPNAQGEVTSEMLGAAGINFRGPAFLAAAGRCVGVTHGQITMAEIVALTHRYH